MVIHGWLHARAYTPWEMLLLVDVYFCASDQSLASADTEAVEGLKQQNSQLLEDAAQLRGLCQVTSLNTCKHADVVCLVRMLCDCLWKGHACVC